jgi:hypothetical protein
MKAGEKDYLYEVLATNLLVLLACKQYSAELNVLNNFTSKSASVVVDADAANDKSPLPASRTTTTTTTHQPTRITACGETRIIREMHPNQSISFDLTIPAPWTRMTRTLPPQPCHLSPQHSFYWP